MYNWSGIYTSEMLQENSENHGNAFLILDNDIFFGQQVWVTFGQIGTPYPLVYYLSQTQNK